MEKEKEEERGEEEESLPDWVFVDVKREVVRQDCLEYWKQKCKKFEGESRNAMLLEHFTTKKTKNLSHNEDKDVNKMEEVDRKSLDYLELTEITTHLMQGGQFKPQGKKVFDLGAGIGRYTDWFCQHSCESVVTVDFIQEFIDKSKALNSHFQTQESPIPIDFICCDVGQLDSIYFIPQRIHLKGTYDLIFSNWLLMYFPDPQLKILIQQFNTWLKPGGIVFFRESCYTTVSGVKVAPGTSPTTYRSPAEYIQFFIEDYNINEYNKENMDGSQSIKGLHWELTYHTHVVAYEKWYSNPHQYIFIFKKL